VFPMWKGKAALKAWSSWSKFNQVQVSWVFECTKWKVSGHNSQLKWQVVSFTVWFLFKVVNLSICFVLQLHIWNYSLFINKLLVKYCCPYWHKCHSHNHCMPTVLHGRRHMIEGTCEWSSSHWSSGIHFWCKAFPDFDESAVVYCGKL